MLEDGLPHVELVITDRRSERIEGVERGDRRIVLERPGRVGRGADVVTEERERRIRVCGTSGLEVAVHRCKPGLFYGALLRYLLDVPVDVGECVEVEFDDSPAVHGRRPRYPGRRGRIGSRRGIRALGVGVGEGCRGPRLGSGNACGNTGLRFIRGSVRCWHSKSRDGRQSQEEGGATTDEHCSVFIHGVPSFIRPPHRGRLRGADLRSGQRRFLDAAIPATPTAPRTSPATVMSAKPSLTPVRASPLEADGEVRTGGVCPGVP
ncbi:Uncharacterised protein [Chlamydia trachomatis]|nr:Uncharacterised protein [Chlamydia trachomatis]